jgi:hypothetical protein
MSSASAKRYAHPVRLCASNANPDGAQAREVLQDESNVQPVVCALPYPPRFG